MIREHISIRRLVAYRTLPAVGLRVALSTESGVWCHGAVVGKVTLARDARLAGLAAGVESSCELSPRVREC